MGDFKHHYCHMAVILLSVLSLCGVFFFNAMSTFPDVIPGLYLRSTGNISDLYYLEITPAGWTFSIWGVIYAWQVVFILYALSTLCRKGIDGYLYYSPELLPMSMYLVYILNNLLNIGWLLLYDRLYVIAAAVFLALIAFTLILCLGFTFVAVKRNLKNLRKNELIREAYLVYFMVHNALAVYCTWTCIATLLNTAQALTYEAGLDQELASSIALGILGGELVLWFVLDNFVLHRYTLYTFTPYLVVLVALGGSLAKNFTMWNRNSIITLALIGTAGLTTMIKFVMMCVRGCRNRE